MEHIKFDDFVRHKIDRTGILLESKKVQYDYGCIMVTFQIYDWNQRIASISDEDLYIEDGKNGKFGKETEPHVTLLYGIHSKEANAQEIINYLKESKPITIKIKGISLFENPKYDVVKYEVESEDLVEMNKYIKEHFPNTQTFPTYKPHMTLAYVKPGMGKKYVKQFEVPDVLNSDTYHYSMAFEDFKQDFYIRSNQGQNGEMVVKIQGVDADQANDLKIFFAAMQQCGQDGMSRKLSINADGSGAFHPIITVDNAQLELTPDQAKLLSDGDEFVVDMD